MNNTLPKYTDTVIIGAGLGGLAMGIGMQKKGLNDYIIIEKSTEVGVHGAIIRTRAAPVMFSRTCIHTLSLISLTGLSATRLGMRFSNIFSIL